MPPQEIVVQVRGMFGERHVLSQLGHNRCEVYWPLFSKPRITAYERSCLLNQHATGTGVDYSVDCTDKCGPLYVASESISDRTSLGICSIVSGDLYELSGHVSSVREKQAVISCLRKSDESTMMLEIAHPMPTLRLREPLDAVLVAFCYFLAAESIFPRLTHYITFFIP
jgi:hypothetical protein